MTKKNRNFTRFLFLACIVFILIVAIIFILQDYDSNVIRFETTISVVSSLVLTFGIIITILQLDETKRGRTTNLTVIKTERAINMMREFADAISDMSFINSIFEDEGYNQLINKYKFDDYKYFSKSEFDKKFSSEKDKQKLTNTEQLLEDNFTNVAKSYLQIYGSSNKQTLSMLLRFCSINWDETALKKKHPGPSGSSEVQLDDIHYRQELSEMRQLRLHISLVFFEKISSTLNRLECFAAYFTSGLADDDIAYSSLHQIYLKTIMGLFPFISIKNINPEVEYYYTNVISLYCLWSNKRRTQELKNEENVATAKRKNQNI